METSTKPAKAASLVSIGEALRKARESKSLTIDQVQKKTRIHATVLLALEDGSCETLMSGTYAKSFLKSYAGFLGLNTEELMKEYSALRQPQQHAAAPAISSPVLRQHRQEAVRPKATDLFPKLMFAAGFIVLLVAALLFANYVWKSSSASFKRPRPSKASVPAKAVTAKAPAKSGSVFASMYIPQKDPIRLTIRIKQPVRVQVKRDGVLLCDRFMPKDLVETFTADSRINVFVAKADAVDITVNGRPFGSPGKGTPKNLEITRSGIRVK